MSARGIGWRLRKINFSDRNCSILYFVKSIIKNCFRLELAESNFYVIIFIKIYLILLSVGINEYAIFVLSK